MKTKNLLTSIISASLLCCTAVSYADDDTGPFAGISANWISADFDDRDDISYNESDTAFEIRGGYMFNDMFGLEVGYLDLGSFSADGKNSSTRIDIDADAFSAAGIASLAIQDQIDIYGKLGVYRVEADRDSTVGDSVLEDNDSDTSAYVAIGVEVDLGEWNFLGQYALADTDVHDLKMDLLSLGVKYEFGPISR